MNSVTQYLIFVRILTYVTTTDKQCTMLNIGNGIFGLNSLYSKKIYNNLIWFKYHFYFMFGK